MSCQQLPITRLNRRCFPSRKGGKIVADEGVVIGHVAPVAKAAADFINAIAQHRHWGREKKDQVPA